MPQTPEMNLPIKANTDHVIKTARVIARHMTALADELEHGEPPPPPERPFEPDPAGRVPTFKIGREWVPLGSGSGLEALLLSFQGECGEHADYAWVQVRERQP